MLAYRVNKANTPAIRIRNGGVAPEKMEFTTYWIYDGDKFTGETVTEPEFFDRYQITTRLSRKEGRFVVEEKVK